MSTTYSWRGLGPRFIRAVVMVMVAIFSVLFAVEDVSADAAAEVSPYAFDATKSGRKVRIALVSSYHRGDTWDKDATRGIVTKLIELGYLDNTAQVDVCISTRSNNNRVIIEVKDNGIGMDEETTKNVFEPLFTTRARGTGLGLAIVDKIVAEHGGKVILESSPQKGTTARVVLPTAETA